MAIVTVLGSVWNLSNAEWGNDTLTFSRGEQIVRVFTIDEIKDMPAINVEKAIISASHANQYGIFTGVALETILDEADENLLKECKKFITKADDGFASVVSTDEILVGANVLVVYEKDGLGLGDYSSGGDGPLRILIVSDDYGNRSTKYLNEINAN